MTAVSDGSLDNAVLLLSKGAAVNATDDSLRTALMFAATQTNSGFISLLAQHGAIVNAQDSDGRTALMRAADMCFYWNIEPLLASGADPNIADKNGRTAVELLVPTSYQKCQTSRQLMQLALHK
jgi:uncharacterized protein